MEKRIFRIKEIDGCTDFQHVTLEIVATVRLIFWGGAKRKSDNSAFNIAAKNVAKDYSGDDVSINKAYSAKKIISIINNQKKLIQSIDFLTHGSQYALYIVRVEDDTDNSYLNKDINEDVEANNLYASKTVKSSQSWFAGSDEGVINDIDFSKFTNNAKIEIHGCKSGADTYMVDNIAINLSENLYDADKLKSVVIAHLTKANPNINGEGKTKISEQDYRHGNRIIYNNGKKLFTTTSQGRITASDINDFLK